MTGLFSLAKAAVVALSLVVLANSQAESRTLYTKPPDSLKSALSTPASAREATAFAAHNRGNMQLLIGNNGTLGSFGAEETDPLTGETILGCIYPKYSDCMYLYGAALWIGAVVGRDTLVSVGSDDWYTTFEFGPTDYWSAISTPVQGFVYKSIDPDDQFYAPDAHSEQDIICEYDDTETRSNLTGLDPFDNTLHKPLNIKIRQHSMVWSFEYADDFVLFDYKIQNIGTETLKQVYMGIWVDGDVLHLISPNEAHTDDIAGFLRTYPAPEGCGFVDTVNIAYHADNDGDPLEGGWLPTSQRAAMGVKVVRTPSDSLRYSFNWWITNYSDPSMDFGPRLRGTAEDPFRDFTTSLGTPLGDRNMYYIMRHNEFDYDELFTAVDHSNYGWLPPPEHAENFADGFDQRYLLSFGPFDIDPGETLPITYAWVAGDNFHQNPTAFQDYWNPYDPLTYYRQFDFSSIATNARWASWIYDNPGVDTDNDGFAGLSRSCCYDSAMTDTGMAYLQCEEMWYQGDGVPDFRGASPPPAPVLWLEPDVGSLGVRFNGMRSETTPDQFTDVIDFEGYRVYIGRDERASSFAMVGSYDIEDYNKYVFDFAKQAFVVRDLPFTFAQLQTLYGEYFIDSVFDPAAATQDSPFYLPGHPDSIFYFVPQDFNQSEFGINTPIKKVYPNQPYPSTLEPLLAAPDELTEEGRFKYFEYEVTIDGLLPTVPYYVNITAFDFGSPEIGIASLETPVSHGAKSAYPLSPHEAAAQGDTKIFIYPNPYRVDAGYETDGFENRDGTLAEDRMRRIHFANLPPVCTIYIYSLDGDLVRRLNHNCPEGDPMSTHDTWDLITRNTQAAVSGLYYWVVESSAGTQMGKLVIIK